jgi:hypothetical protein
MTLIKSGAQSARALLDRVLDRPTPLALVQSLAPETVIRLIERIGLEDVADLIALLSPEQLTEVFDHDLWQSARPGHDAQFDAQRFGLWLALLVEQSPALAAQKLSQLDFDLVALGLSTQLLVLDMDRLAESVLPTGYSDDDRQLDKLLETGLYHELEQYRLIAREAHVFDALLAILTELNMHDYGFLCELLERCAVLSDDYIEDNGGLYEVLSAAQTIEADVAGDREDRRERKGFVTPSSALAFLKLARDTPWQELIANDSEDPLTRAHSRALERAQTAQRAPEERRPKPPFEALALAGPAAQTADTRLMATLEALLADEPSTLARLPQATQAPSLLARALVELCARDVQSYERCLLSASYLANVALAAIGSAQDKLEPGAAAEVAFAVCELGADELVRSLPKESSVALDALAQKLARAGLVKLFQLGFQRMCAAKAPARLQKSAALRRLRGMLETQGLVLGGVSARTRGSDPRASTQRGVRV